MSSPDSSKIGFPLDIAETNLNESCCTPIARREFLKIVGAGAAAHLGMSSWPIMAGPFDASKVSHHVPADKKLSSAWVKSLFERGQPEIYRGKQLATVGMPIGGIATGLAANWIHARLR